MSDIAADEPTPAQFALKSRYGTPAEFARTVLNSGLGFVSLVNARDMIERYRRQWDDAGRGEAT